MACNFIKKETLAQCVFLWILRIFLRTPFSRNTSGRLPLYFQVITQNFTFFTEHLWATACEFSSYNPKYSQLTKLQDSCPVTWLKKRLWHSVFSCELCEISKNTFFTEHLWAIASEFSSYNPKYFQSTKLQDSWPVTLLKKRLWHSVFFCEFCEFF